MEIVFWFGTTRGKEESDERRREVRQSEDEEDICVLISIRRNKFSKERAIWYCGNALTHRRAFHLKASTPPKLFHFSAAPLSPPPSPQAGKKYYFSAFLCLDRLAPTYIFHNDSLAISPSLQTIRKKIAFTTHSCSHARKKFLYFEVSLLVLFSPTQK